MRFIADFHIHSHYSRATSKNLTPEFLDFWARIKGIDVVGTGDCQHPGWLKELKEKLEPIGNGLFRLKPDVQHPLGVLDKSPISKKMTQFILTTEISLIYKKGGQVRKIHHVCVFPNFEAVDHFQAKLAAIGNIESDGRPILGLDSKDLLDIVLNTHPKAFLIPAHIWTPWFSVLGSKSGFDSVQDCFEELTPHIFAVETGLSSDPPMNRTCSFLDDFVLVSNSDAHSPEKLGREANLFDTDLSYDGMLNALKTRQGFEGTIEFFPNEGKYHYDGHRVCKTFWNPDQTRDHNGICPVCRKPVTKGVMYRVSELADRSVADIPPEPQTYRSITPLPELVGEMVGMGVKSKRVQAQYLDYIQTFGSEFNILLDEPLSSLGTKSPVFKEGIRRLRAGEVHVESGYDGVFGKIKVFGPE